MLKGRQAPLVRAGGAFLWEKASPRLQGRNF